jgi:hypothetical protein
LPEYYAKGRQSEEGKGVGGKRTISSGVRCWSAWGEESRTYVSVADGLDVTHLRNPINTYTVERVDIESGFGRGSVVEKNSAFF